MNRFRTHHASTCTSKNNFNKLTKKTRMTTRNQNREGDSDTDEQTNVSKKVAAVGSDNDTGNRVINLQITNARAGNMQGTRKNLGYRMKVSPVPVYEQEYYLRPAIIRRRKSCSSSVVAKVGSAGAEPHHQTKLRQLNPATSPNADIELYQLSSTVKSPVLPLCPSPDLLKNKPDTNSIPSTIKYLVCLFVILPILLVPYYWIPISTYGLRSEACNMNKIENRDFHNYYGISESENCFKRQTAVECDSNFIFKSVLPPGVLKQDKSASSFMILSKYGTGKTLLRCHYFNNLQSKDYFKILILNAQLNEYLQRFVAETSPDRRYSETENYLIGWSKTEFVQLILSLLVTQFVDAFEKEQFDLPNMSLDGKIELITIVCYYYNEQGVSKLENFVNWFFEKIDHSIYSASKAEGQILERNQFRDKPLLLHFKTDLKKFKMLRKDGKKLELLLAIVEGEGYQHIAIDKTMSDDVFNSLTYFTQFMRNYIKKPVVFIIDGIDENQYFFQKNTVDRVSLDLFYRSTISREILSAVMAQNFYLSLFYPEIDGIDIRDVIIRNDNFPVYRIEWNTKSLINYADYILQNLNKNALTTRCKSLPNFTTLVNYTNPATAGIIDRILTPKALHHFIEKLILEMNNCASYMEEPFIATNENVDNAFKKSIT
jgi:hypothetical protein